MWGKRAKVYWCAVARAIGSEVFDKVRFMITETWQHHDGTPFRSLPHLISGCELGDVTEVHIIACTPFLIAGAISTKNKRHYNLQLYRGALHYSLGSEPESILHPVRIQFPEHAEWDVYCATSRRYQIQFCLMLEPQIEGA
jgi:hypothetical protein